MSSDSERSGPPIGSIEDLVALFAAGEKSADNLRVGTEHEKLPFHVDTLQPVAYDRGICEILTGMGKFGWQPVEERGAVVELRRDGARVTLEPGGQLELSGVPVATIHQTAAELDKHLHEVQQIAEPLGIAFSHSGMRPLESAAQMPWMPRERHQVMRDYLPKRGRLAHDVMLLTSSVQVNFDYCSEADMVAKMRCAMGISPVIAALFANSPFAHGQWRGRRSQRYASWQEFDPARCGLLSCVFAEDFGYRRYINYIFDVPVMFLRRNGRYVSVDGRPFRDFLASAGAEQSVTVADFENQLSCIFPEVRLKTFLEVRSADNGSQATALAISSLWKGLLYDDQARRDAYGLVENLSFSERLAMQRAAAQDGLRGHGPAWHLGELAQELLRLAKDGLRRQGCVDEKGRDESLYLAPIEPLAAAQTTRADRLLEQFGAGPFDAAGRRRLVLASSY